MNRALAFLFWYDFLARPYDPTHGQFSGPDQKAEEYYPWNPFTFCLNNPMRYEDPDGKVEAYSHEANGHVLLYVRSGYDRHAASHHYSGNIDKNIILKTLIMKSKMETIKNY